LAESYLPSASDEKDDGGDDSDDDDGCNYSSDDANIVAG
jgi:hypothetical protein